jgi:hypothetical protein
METHTKLKTGEKMNTHFGHIKGYIQQPTLYAYSVQKYDYFE